MPPRILVTGSSTFFAARLIHDLGRRGAIVTAADSLPLSPGKAIRYVSRRLRVPRVGSDPEGYLAAILAELRGRSYDLLLPTFEEALLLAEYQAELRPHARLFLPQFEAMYRLHHKPSLHAHCTALGLPTPPMRIVDHPHRLWSVPGQLGLPVVLKLPAGNNSSGRAFCGDENTLHDRFHRLAAEQQRCGGELPFVQKRIQGQLICTLCFCLEGRKLAEVVYRTSRMFPQSGGTAAHRQSIVHPEISGIAERLIAANNWSGFLGLDFLLEDETGIPYVIDANPRANPAIHLGFCAGLDWSQIILDLARDKSPALQMARTGINVHSLLIDFAWLVQGLLPRAGGIRRFPQRFGRFLFPEWPVHSRDDLLEIGEWASASVLGAQTMYTMIKSLVTGRQPGRVLLEHANYDPTTAAAFRAKRVADSRPRSAA